MRFTACAHVTVLLFQPFESGAVIVSADTVVAAAMDNATAENSMLGRSASRRGQVGVRWWMRANLVRHVIKGRILFIYVGGCLMRVLGERFSQGCRDVT